MTKKHNKEEQDMKPLIKSIIAIGLITLASIAVAIPVFKHVNGDDLDLSGRQKSIVYAYDEGSLTDLVVEETSDASENDAEHSKSRRKYMALVADIFDPDLNPDDVPLYSSVPGDFADPFLKEEAERFYSQGYLLTDKKTEVKYWGYGIGCGNYVFIDGFDVYDSVNDEPAFSIDIVKATQDEFEEFMNEFTKIYSNTEKVEGEETISYIYSGDYCTYEITYYPNKELLIQEFYFAG